MALLGLLSNVRRVDNRLHDDVLVRECVIYPRLTIVPS